MKLVMGRFRASLILSVIFCLICTYGIGQDYPMKPEPAVYVNDFANVFANQQKSVLEAILVDYYDSTSTQIVIVTVESLQGMDASQYATELGEKWGVGQGAKDNGVLFLVAPKDRKMFIASGRGTEEKLTDVFLGRIRDRYILPEFKNGDYYNGVYLGVMQIMNRLSGAFKAEEEEQSQGISLTVLIFIIVIMFIVFWVLAKFSKGANYGETFSGKGYRGGGFWGTGSDWGGGSSWGGGSWGGGSSGGSFGGGSFGGGGAGGSW